MTTDEIIDLTWTMIEEAQAEANLCTNHYVRDRLLAKRDALAELRLRVRWGKFDVYWCQKWRRYLLPQQPS